MDAHTVLAQLSIHKLFFYILFEDTLWNKANYSWIVFTDSLSSHFVAQKNIDA